MSTIVFIVIWFAAIAFIYLVMEKTGPFHKAWEKYEGAIITAIKVAEKAIPADIPNAGLRRLDQALNFVLERYAEEHGGKQPDAKLLHELKEGIQIKHAELERLGNLRKLML